MPCDINYNVCESSNEFGGAYADSMTETEYESLLATVGSDWQLLKDLIATISIEHALFFADVRPRTITSLPGKPSI